MNDATITRRRAIGATGSLFLGAGLLAAAGAPAPRTTEDVAADVRALLAEYRRYRDE